MFDKEYPRPGLSSASCEDLWKEAECLFERPEHSLSGMFVSFLSCRGAL